MIQVLQDMITSQIQNLIFLKYLNEYIVSVRAFNNFGESEPVIAVATAGTCNEDCKINLIRVLSISRKKER